MKATYNIAGLTIVAEDGGASLEGTLKDDCPYCSCIDCYSNCEDQETEEDIDFRQRYNNVMDGIESLLIALAAEGEDVSTERFAVAIQTAIEAAANEHS